MSIFPVKWTFKSRKTLKLETDLQTAREYKKYAEDELGRLRKLLRQANDKLAAMEHFKADMEQVKKVATASINKRVTDSVLGMVFKDTVDFMGIPSAFLYPESIKWR